MMKLMSLLEMQNGDKIVKEKYMMVSMIVSMHISKSNKQIVHVKIHGNAKHLEVVAQKLEKWLPHAHITMV